MTAVLGRWRASYAPGDWLVLAGPTSLVMLELPAADDRGMTSALWDEVVSSSSMGDLAGRLAGYGIDTLPSLAAFFWTDDGMRSLVRGSVSILEVPTGRVLAQGDGIQTWTEVGLAEVRRVLVEPDSGGEDTGEELPLVVGAVRASSVLLDSTAEAQVSSPQGRSELSASAADELEPDQVGPAEPEERAEPEQPAEPVEPAEPRTDAGTAEEAAAEQPAAADEGVPPAFWDDESAGSGGPPQGPPAEAASVGGLATEQMTDPFGDSEVGTAGTESPPPARALDPDLLAQIENADTQLMPMPLPPPEQPSAPGVSQDSLIMAVVCPNGHPSPQNATSCRVCSSPIAPQGPRLLPRPVLAVLRSSDGSTADVDRAVLVGRAPSAQRSSARAPRLMTVPSPAHDISRTHLEVAPDGWQIAVTDLNSTNGTVLVRPEGVDRQQMAPGETILVQLGTVVELGDGISILIDFPQ